jgi:predicted metal-dependent peptidase
MHREADMSNATTTLPIILTDGYANLNLDYNTSLPLLWAISPGGVKSEDIPYGEVVRIIK